MCFFFFVSEMLSGRIYLYLLLYLCIQKVCYGNNKKEENEEIVLIEEEDVEEDANKVEVIKIVAAPDLSKENNKIRVKIENEESDEDTNNVNVKLDVLNNDIFKLIDKTLKEKYPHMYNIDYKNLQDSENESKEEKTTDISTENSIEETEGSYLIFEIIPFYITNIYFFFIEYPIQNIYYAK